MKQFIYGLAFGMCAFLAGDVLYTITHRVNIQCPKGQHLVPVGHGIDKETGGELIAVMCDGGKP